MLASSFKLKGLLCSTVIMTFGHAARDMTKIRSYYNCIHLPMIRLDLDKLLENPIPDELNLGFVTIEGSNRRVRAYDELPNDFFDTEDIKLPMNLLGIVAGFTLPPDMLKAWHRAVARNVSGTPIELLARSICLDDTIREGECVDVTGAVPNVEAHQYCRVLLKITRRVKGKNVEYMEWKMGRFIIGVERDATGKIIRNDDGSDKQTMTVRWGDFDGEDPWNGEPSAQFDYNFPKTTNIRLIKNHPHAEKQGDQYINPKWNYELPETIRDGIKILIHAPEKGFHVPKADMEKYKAKYITSDPESVYDWKDETEKKDPKTNNANGCCWWKLW